MSRSVKDMWQQEEINLHYLKSPQFLSCYCSLTEPILTGVGRKDLLCEQVVLGVGWQ